LQQRITKRRPEADAKAGQTATSLTDSSHRRVKGGDNGQPFRVRLRLHAANQASMTKQRFNTAEAKRLQQERAHAEKGVNKTEIVLNKLQGFKRLRRT
jgi:hypothetical protein